MREITNYSAQMWESRGEFSIIVPNKSGFELYLLLNTFIRADFTINGKDKATLHLNNLLCS